MRSTWRAADDADHVRRAAIGWHAAGLLDDAAAAAIAEEYPAPEPQLGETWRVLVFICVAVGVCAATLLVLFGFGVREEGSVALILLTAGAALALLTDIIVDRFTCRPTGAEAATSLLAVSYLSAAAFVLNDHFHWRGPPAQSIACAWAAAVLALAAWRWGFRLYAGTAAIAILLAAAQFPGARLIWLATAALVAVGAGAARARHDLAPSHRDGLTLVRFVALAAVYVAINYYSVDKGLIEEIGRAVGAPRHRPDQTVLWLAGAASTVYPLWLLARGLRARDRVLVDLGIVAAALSLATVRLYVHVPPLWAVFAIAGAMLAGGALLLERWLRAGRDRERSGFTAAVLSDESRRGRLLSVAAGLAAAPETRNLPEEPGDVHGGAGGFGGGGSTGTY